MDLVPGKLRETYKFHVEAIKAEADRSLNCFFEADGKGRFMLPLIELVLNFLPIVRWIVGDESVIFQTVLGADWLLMGLRFLG